MLAANKSDLVQVGAREYAKGVVEQVEKLMPDVRAPPVVSVCALNGEKCDPTSTRRVCGGKRSSMLFCSATDVLMRYLHASKKLLIWPRLKKSSLL